MTPSNDAYPGSSLRFSRDMRGNMMYNVADTGALMGLGRRKRFHSDTYDELRKRQAFLEETGMMMGLGKRSGLSQEKYIDTSGLY